MDNSVDLQLLLDSGRNPQSVKVVSKIVTDQERIGSMLADAYQFALRKGIESEMKGIQASLSDPVTIRSLDAIYNFSPLMLQDRVIPPVITESRDLIQNKSGMSLKTTGLVYKIDKQARFSTLPPNWRSYLTFPVNDYLIDYSEIPTKELLPKNSREYEQWKRKTVSGFTEGQKIAREKYSYSLNRLNTDYEGMVRFHKMVIEGKISMPSISRTDLALTNNGSVMAIDQKLLSIRTLPSFDGNMIKWTTWQVPVENNPSSQAVTINNAE